MKMAAAEALYDTETPAPFSLFTVGTLDGGGDVRHRGARPAVLPGHRQLDGEVQGINDLQAQYVETYGQDPGAAYYSAGATCRSSR